MTTKINILLWHKFHKQRRPKTSSKNSVRWFRKTSLEEVYKVEFSNNKSTIRTCLEWKIFINLKTRLLGINFFKFFKTEKTILNHQILTALLIKTLGHKLEQEASLLTIDLECKPGIVSLDNIKMLKPRYVQWLYSLHRRINWTCWKT